MLSYGEFFIKINTCYQIYLFLYGVLFNEPDPRWSQLSEKTLFHRPAEVSRELLSSLQACQSLLLSIPPAHPQHLSSDGWGCVVGRSPVTDPQFTMGLGSPSCPRYCCCTLVRDIIFKGNKVGHLWAQPGSQPDTAVGGGGRRRGGGGEILPEQSCSLPTLLHWGLTVHTP